MNPHGHELWLIAIVSIVGLFVARDCVGRTPTVNLFPQIIHCQTCPCPATDAVQKPEIKKGKKR